MDKKQLLEASLEDKIKQTKRLIMDWYEQFNGQVYIAFSGGKDSTVLLHIARSIYPDIVGVFANTGLEYPEIVETVKKTPNIVTLRPKKTFKQVLEKYGYPIISKEQSQYISQFRNAKSQKTKDTRWDGNRWGLGKISEKWKFIVTDHPELKVTDRCCDFFKKEPFKRYEKETGKKGIVGTMASESNHRKTLYLKDDCNGFNAKRPISKPLSFWSESDIYKYIRDFDVEISEIYSMGYNRTGCIFCMYGLHLDGEIDRFDRMKKTHPKLFTYCMDKLGLREVIKKYTGKEYNQIDLFD